jgi:hypothetical protein
MAIKAAEFDYFLKVFLRLSKLIAPQFDVNDPAYIENWRSKFTPSQQRLGLESGLSDLAEDGFDLSLEERRKVDNAMRSEGLMTLSELQVHHGKRIKRLLRKKKLVHEEDAIALKGMLDSHLLDEQEAEIATRLIDNFGS